jgi:hypothetical protein
MPRLKEVCRYIRSKVAGPFWVTLDIFFRERETFERYVDSPALQSDAIADLFEVDRKTVKRFVVPDLMVIKFSYPRACPQGGVVERDLHSGQQYVRVLDIGL